MRYSHPSFFSVNPIFIAFSNINAKAASCSLGIIPSKIASLIALFRAPTSRQGANPKTSMISAPSTGGWKLRMRSFSYKSFNF